MARNKYPEETRERILMVSCDLFLEKGYDATSIQDIINGLGGLSKGAIYHHFKSKEDIMIAVGERHFHGIVDELAAVRDAKDLNGAQKLKKMFEVSLKNPELPSTLTFTTTLLQNAQMLALQVQDIMEESVPDFVQPILEEGIADGSIQTQYPKQLAEIIMIMSNLWLNPTIFTADAQAIMQRLLLMRDMLDAIGISVFDESMMEQYVEYMHQYEKQKDK